MSPVTKHERQQVHLNFDFTSFHFLSSSFLIADGSVESDLQKEVEPRRRVMSDLHSFSCLIFVFNLFPFSFSYSLSAAM